MESEGHSVGVWNPYLRCQPIEMTGIEEVRAREQRPRPVTINPYIRPAVNHLKDNNNSHSTMPQSQWRKSSILQCKQKASFFRGPRTYNRSERTNRSCRVCKVKEHNKQIEKQLHDARKAQATEHEIRKLESYLKSIPATQSAHCQLPR